MNVIYNIISAPSRRRAISNNHGMSGEFDGFNWAISAISNALSRIGVLCIKLHTRDRVIYVRDKYMLQHNVLYVCNIICYMCYENNLNENDIF